MLTALVMSVVVVYNVMVRVDDVSTFVMSSLRGHNNHRIHVDNININHNSDLNDHDSKHNQGIVNNICVQHHGQNQHQFHCKHIKNYHNSDDKH